MGQILTLDFEDTCTTFVTGTSLGWVQIWSLQNKCLTRRFRTVEGIGKQIYVPNVVRILNIDKAIISYSILTKQLVITSIKTLPLDGEEQEADTQSNARSTKPNNDKSPNKKADPRAKPSSASLA